MEDKSAPPTVLTRWVDRLRELGLDAWALVLVNVLEVWGFVGGQLVWMLAPFVGQGALAPLAEALESPDALQKLRAYVVEGDV